MFRWLRSGHKNRYSLENLNHLYLQLLKYPQVTEANKNVIIEILRQITELMIWGDQHNPLFFDFFLERNMLVYFLKYLDQKVSKNVKVQLLQTLSIFIENIKNETCIYYLFSNNHINDLIVHKFDFSDDELLAYYISFLKTISLKLNKSTIQFFFNEESRDFPLYTEALNFHRHQESMVRIAVRTLTLNVYRVEDDAMRSFILDQSSVPYFHNLVWFIREQATSIEEHLRKALSGGESRVDGDLGNLVLELLDNFYYLNDIFDLSIHELNHRLTDRLIEKFVVPSLVMPLEEGVLAPSPHSSNQMTPSDGSVSPLLSLFLVAQLFHVFCNSTLVSELAGMLFDPLKVDFLICREDHTVMSGARKENVKEKLRKYSLSIKQKLENDNMSETINLFGELLDGADKKQEKEEKEKNVPAPTNDIPDLPTAAEIPMNNHVPSCFLSLFQHSSDPRVWFCWLIAVYSTLHNRSVDPNVKSLLLLGTSQEERLEKRTSQLLFEESDLIRSGGGDSGALGGLRRCETHSSEDNDNVVVNDDGKRTLDKSIQQGVEEDGETNGNLKASDLGSADIEPTEVDSISVSSGVASSKRRREIMGKTASSNHHNQSGKVRGNIKAEETGTGTGTVGKLSLRNDPSSSWTLKPSFSRASSLVSSSLPSDAADLPVVNGMVSVLSESRRVIEDSPSSPLLYNEELVSSVLAFLGKDDPIPPLLSIKLAFKILNEILNGKVISISHIGSFCFVFNLFSSRCLKSLERVPSDKFLGYFERLCFGMTSLHFSGTVSNTAILIPPNDDGESRSQKSSNWETQVHLSENHAIERDIVCWLLCHSCFQSLEASHNSLVKSMSLNSPVFPLLPDLSVFSTSIATTFFPLCVELVNKREERPDFAPSLTRPKPHIEGETISLDKYKLLEAHVIALNNRTLKRYLFCDLETEQVLVVKTDIHNESGIARFVAPLKEVHVEIEKSDDRILFLATIASFTEQELMERADRARKKKAASARVSTAVGVLGSGSPSPVASTPPPTPPPTPAPAPKGSPTKIIQKELSIRLLFPSRSACLGALELILKMKGLSLASSLGIVKALFSFSEFDGIELSNPREHIPKAVRIAELPNIEPAALFDQSSDPNDGDGDGGDNDEKEEEKRKCLGVNNDNIHGGKAENNGNNGDEEKDDNNIDDKKEKADSSDASTLNNLSSKSMASSSLTPQPQTHRHPNSILRTSIDAADSPLFVRESYVTQSLNPASQSEG